MEILNSPQDFLYNLKATSSSEAKRLWKQSIKEKWNHQCAYCSKSELELTIDHIIPQSLGGNDHITNVVCCCLNCNRDKAHENWEQWFFRQKFFTEERYNAILNWQRQLLKSELNLYKYKPRRNKVL